MKQTLSRPSFVSSGVTGLDAVLRGGLVRGSFFLVQGDPGSGKTTLALQFASERVKASESCLYITLTETRADLELACASHDWSLEGLHVCDLTSATTDVPSQSSVSIFHPGDTELSDLMQAVLDEIERVKPQSLVFDGLSELRLLSGEPLRYRRLLLSLKQELARREITTLLLDDRTSQFGEVQPESLVGGNLVLESNLPAYGRARRRLHVTKVRGANFQEGYHDYQIVTGGVLVHPRLVASDHSSEFEPGIRASGIENLDVMLQGGLTTGSTALMLGPAGAGKSTTTMQFVMNALDQGHKAAVYLFDEVMHTLLSRSEKLCRAKSGGIRSWIEEGRLHVQQVDPAEMAPGAFADEVRRAVEDGAKVIVIDSLNGYLNAMPEERFLTAHLHEMFSYLNQKGILTIIVVAQHGMMASSSIPADVDVSYLADTVLLFRYFEASGEVLQAVSVFKKRTGAHDRSIRQLTIDSNGLSVGEPLRHFRGIMTGVPQYVGPDVGAKGAAAGQEQAK